MRRLPRGPWTRAAAAAAAALPARTRRVLARSEVAAAGMAAMAAERAARIAARRAGEESGGPSTPMALRGQSCTICLSPLGNPRDRPVYTIQGCQHNFHRDCLVENRRSGHTVCPCCRGDLEVGLTPASTRRSEQAQWAEEARRQARQEARRARRLADLEAQREAQRARRRAEREAAEQAERERRQREEEEARRREEAGRQRLRRLANNSGNAREQLWNAQWALNKTQQEMDERMHAARLEVRAARSVLDDSLREEEHFKRRFRRYLEERRSSAGSGSG